VYLLAIDREGLFDLPHLHTQNRRFRLEKSRFFFKTKLPAKIKRFSSVIAARFSGEIAARFSGVIGIFKNAGRLVEILEQKKQENIAKTVSVCYRSGRVV